MKNKTRNFKFRVWDIKDRAFCYFDNLLFYTGDSESRILDGVPMYVGKLHSMGNCFYKKGKHTRPIYNSYMESDRYVIQQFTGIKDKVGRDIYEGDIVLYELSYAEVAESGGDNDIDEVIFEHGTFKLKNGDRLDELQDGSNKLTDDKVIGNIFENPDYLKD